MGGATEVNETQKWATSKKRLRTTDVDYPQKVIYLFLSSRHAVLYTTRGMTPSIATLLRFS
jgi:hypothetical protein